MDNTAVRNKVLDAVGRAMGTFAMLRPGDRVAVGVSGGKDSMCLLDALARYRMRAPFDYDLVAVTVEQGKFTSPIEAIGPSIERLGIRWVVEPEPRTLRLVDDGVEHGCDVCSRHRRGALYAVASDEGCSVLALGHTADDCAEALLRNVLFNGRIASLPPVAASRKGTLRVIRPLCYVPEAWTARYAASHALTTVGCVCAETDGPRSEIRTFLGEMDRRHVGVAGSVSAALGNVNPYTLFDARLRREGADAPAFAAGGTVPPG